MVKVLCGILLLISLNPAHSQTKELTFVPHWLPQAQFAGYYIAFDQGIYKKHGINLKIVNGGVDNPSSECIKDGKADFVLLWLTTGIELRDKGVKLVNIAQMIQKSALMLVAKKSSGIKDPKDLNGKKIGLWGGDFQIQPLAFFKKYKIKGYPVQQGSSINLFLLDGVDVTSAMWYNEYHQILASGYDPDELTTFFFSEHGLNFPEDGIYVTEDFFNKNVKVCQEFVDASIEGWLWAFKNQDKAIAIISKYMKAAKIPVNKAHQNWMLSRMKDLMFDKSSGTIKKTLLENDYNFVAKTLLEGGNIKAIPAFNQICGTEGK